MTEQASQKEGRYDDAKSPREPILEPTSLDILHGKDSGSRNHIGNKSFRALIRCDLIKDQYLQLSTQSEKSSFFTSLVHTIEASGGRFLSNDSSGRGWKQDAVKEAKDKVGQALRDMKKKQLKTCQGNLESPLVSPFSISALDFDWRNIVGIVKNGLATKNNKTSMQKETFTPTDLDILHGHDDFAYSHIGNQCFRILILCSLDEYKALQTRPEKSQWLENIVHSIRRGQG